LFENGSTFCEAMYLVDVNGECPDALGKGFSDGDPDAEAWPVPGSLRMVPWSDEPRAQCLLTLKNFETKQPTWFEPRVILQSVSDKFASLGLTPVIAVELEFHLLDKERDENNAPQPPLNPRTRTRSWSGKVFSLDMLDDFAAPLKAITDACVAQDLPVSTALSEYGACQFEVNLNHVSDPLRAADDAAYLRRAVQFAARHAGYDATFISKPYPDISGSGLHVHMSLLDDEGNNIFDPANANGNDKLGHVVAGLQAMLGEAMAIFAPNLNAFRRFKPDQFVPVTKDWGLNNRSMAFRIPPSDDANRRIEHRAAGAEANPYLVIAALLAGAHHGLTNQLAPTAQAGGNAGAEVDETLPLKPWQAFDAIANAEILSDYFSGEFLHAYATVKRAEFEALMDKPFRREFEWYL
ncbi:MAG: glutamine synthetase family protein, partial [Hyphomicrobiales bacterium]